MPTQGDRTYAALAHRALAGPGSRCGGAATGGSLVSSAVVLLGGQAGVALAAAAEATGRTGCQQQRSDAGEHSPRVALTVPGCGGRAYGMRSTLQ